MRELKSVLKLSSLQGWRRRPQVVKQRARNASPSPHGHLNHTSSVTKPWTFIYAGLRRDPGDDLVHNA